MPCDGLERRIARWMPLFSAFTAFTPEIPKLYWDVKSQEQRYFTICEDLHKIVCYLDCLSDHVNMDHDDIEELKALFKEFMESGFDDYFEERIIEWLDTHQKEVWEALGKMVFFGLTMDGYFCAYVPDSWSDITFDTGAVYGTYEYGRLILRYNVEGQGVIDNTGSQLPSMSQWVREFEDLRKRVERNEDTLYRALQRNEG